jgi:hypothetical protein
MTETTSGQLSHRHPARPPDPELTKSLVGDLRSKSHSTISADDITPPVLAAQERPASPPRLLLTEGTRSQPVTKHRRQPRAKEAGVAETRNR